MQPFTIKKAAALVLENITNGDTYDEYDYQAALEELGLISDKDEFDRTEQQMMADVEEEVKNFLKQFRLILSPYSEEE